MNAHKVSSQGVLRADRYLGPYLRGRPVLSPEGPRLGSDGDLDLNASLDVDDDLLDDLGGGSQVDEALVDAHLEAVPGLGTLTAGGLAGGDLEGLGGQADGALEAQVLALGALDDLGADLLEDLDLAGGQGDADLVALLQRQGLCQSSKI